MASIELHEAFEIKPDTPDQRRAGQVQLRAFIALLTQGDREYLSLQQRYPGKLYPKLVSKTWRPGTSFLPRNKQITIGTLGEITITFSRVGAGLIVWDTDGSREEVKQLADAVAKNAIKFVPVFPVTEDQANRKAQELSLQTTNLAREVALFVTAFGVAVAVIALFAALTTLLPVAVPAAVISTFALTLSINSKRSAGSDMPQLT